MIQQRLKCKVQETWREVEVKNPDGLAERRPRQLPLFKIVKIVILHCSSQALHVISFSHSNPKLISSLRSIVDGSPYLNCTSIFNSSKFATGETR